MKFWMTMWLVCAHEVAFAQTNGVPSMMDKSEAILRFRDGLIDRLQYDDVAGLRARGCIRANQWCAIDDGSNRSDHALAGWLDRQFQQGRCGSVAHASGHECGGDLAERGSVDGAGRGAGILQPNDERRAAGGAGSEREAGDFRTAYLW